MSALEQGQGVALEVGQVRCSTIEGRGRASGQAEEGLPNKQARLKVRAQREKEREGRESTKGERKERRKDYQDAGKLEPLYTAGGNAKYCNCYRKRLSSSSKLYT